MMTQVNLISRNMLLRTSVVRERDTLVEQRKKRFSHEDDGIFKVDILNSNFPPLLGKNEKMVQLLPPGFAPGTSCM